MAILGLKKSVKASHHLGMKGNARVNHRIGMKGAHGKHKARGDNNPKSEGEYRNEVNVGES